ncbi:hypothetical protein HO133_001502 [Letharia lupina]|uniref:Uncharacterized protein n=1 Tax=Letharia lupina TaxID=560253 RepID=A0A8H6CFR4_9LECA|nr:uncharacterized protein HO133_001502 [Letharia lupina]KAF6222416.1 hypothetical protein HO133_001502 [Letharia lupina]
MAPTTPLNPTDLSSPLQKRRTSESYRPQLPSSDFRRINVGDVTNPHYNSDPPPSGHPQPADAAAVLNELLSQLILRSGKRVLLVRRSSGAFTATTVAVPEPQARTRKAKGASGGTIDGSAPVIPP